MIIEKCIIGRCPPISLCFIHETWTSLLESSLLDLEAPETLAPAHKEGNNSDKSSR